MNKLPIDVVQLIGLATCSMTDYLHLAVTSKQHSKMLIKERRDKALQYFTTVEIDENGTKSWYINGKRHRENGPAIEYASGYKAWYKNGKRHRENGPAVEWANGNKYWYKNGELHREDGPAVVYAGYKEWYKNGKLHREDGPAIVYANGYKEWYKNGKQIENPNNT